MTNHNDLLIDADGVLVYGAGWSGTNRWYVLRGKEFKYKKDALKFGPEEELQSVVDAAPLDHVLHNVRQTFDYILESLSPVNSYKAYLTGKDNFRDKIATIQPYKGNRSPDAKPPHYKEIRQYLQDQYNVEMVNGMEADDKIAIEFTKSPMSIVVGEDKDYLQLPLLRMWNPKKKEMIHVSVQDAYKNFHRQLLMGDTVDAIKGVEGIGSAKAEKLLAGHTCPMKMEEVCYWEYKRVYGTKAWDYFVENARLLYLLRHENDQWEPKVKR